MTMEYILVGISVFLLLLNLILLITVKKRGIDEEENGIYESMANFVAQIEQENDELYDKLLAYIKNSETQLSNRIERLEKNNAVTISEVEMPHETSVEIDKVMQLSKQGFSPKQIAKVLQVDFGKVELIVHMNSIRRNNYKKNEVH